MGCRGRLTSLAVAVLTAALVSAVWAGVASAAPGTLEICKTADNGTSGQSFSFTATHAGVSTPVTVQGNSCSGPGVLSGNGTWTITENNSANWVFVGATAVPPAALVSVTPSKSQVKVTVAANADTAVFVTNAGATGNVKVCKTSKSFSGQYSFTVNGTPVTAVANGACSIAVDQQPGSRINITESVPAGEQVAAVTTSANLKIRSQGLNAAGTVYTVRVTTGVGANVITFDNEPVSPNQQGFFQICKSSGGDPFIDAVTTPFQFTVTDSTGAVQSVGVFVGQCSGAIQVMAGNVHVVETIPNNTFVQGISVAGAGALGPVNLTNGEATVVVPIASAGDTLVSFTDNASVGTLKVCKYVTASSGALAGTKFNFKVSDPAIPDGQPGSKSNPVPVTVIATASALGTCTIVTFKGTPVAFPVGSTATAIEDLSSFNGYVTSDQPGDTGSTAIGSGINSISVTNQALGQLEICKDMIGADSAYTGFVFSFSYKNTDSTVTDPRASGTTLVSPGHCSPPIKVVPGNYTITENLSKTTTSGASPKPAPFFQFVSSTATGPTGDNRCVPPAANCGNPLTVSVPYFLSSDPVAYGETKVSIVNKVQRAQFKICKQIAPGSETPLGKLSYAFEVTWTGGPTPAARVTVDPSYPSCTGLIGGSGGIPNIPIIQPDNSPTQITVGEEINGDYQVQSITIDQGTVVSNTPPSITFNPAVGTTVVTFTNAFNPPQSLQLCKSMITADAAYVNFSFPISWKNTNPLVVDPRASGTVNVAPGTCVTELVPPGAYTILETPPTGFAFVSSTAVGTVANDNRCVPPAANCGNPATVNVPPASPGSTKVTFVNMVQRAQISICKAIDPSTPSIGNLKYTFDATWTGGPATPTKVTLSPPYPGCSSTTLNSPDGIPVIQPDGSATKVAIQEELGQYTVSNIALDHGNVITNAPPMILFNPAAGKSSVTFTNTATPTQQGSCLASSSLAVLVQGSNVVSYVPKGRWNDGTTGIAAVNIEGTSITNTLIPTTSNVNSCASNWATGETVCVANNTNVYLITGTTAGTPLTSGASGVISFSGGSCTNCGVAIDGVHNKAVIAESVAGAPGYQFLNLGTAAFEPPFASRAARISEGIMLDPTRNLLLSAAETNVFELVDVTTSTSPAFYENAVVAPGLLDATAEDCSTGIALASVEEGSSTAEVYIGDLTQATKVAGSPGSWTAPAQFQTLTEANDGTSAPAVGGIAVAQGTHTAVLGQEFGGSNVTALALPSTSGSGTPAVQDWVTCSISGFTNGRDPHTLTAYQSPTGGHAIALLYDPTANQIARVDLTQMLNIGTVPRTGGGHGCASGTLPGSVVTLIPVP
jgi:hypothetical protein